MKNSIATTAIEIMGKSYQIKCPEVEISALKQSAKYLEEQMRLTREVGNVLCADKIAVITALNIVHQFITLERNNHSQLQTLTQRLHEIQNKIEIALAQNKQMELQPAG